MTEYEYWKARLDLESRRAFHESLKKEMSDRGAPDEEVTAVMKLEHEYHFELMRLEKEYFGQRKQGC